MPTVAELTAQLRNNMDAAEKLRQRRKELKAALSRDGMAEREEAPLAKELVVVCGALEKLDEDRKRLCEGLPAATT